MYLQVPYRPSIILGGHANSTLLQPCGEDYYLAPEVVNEGKRYTQAADKWALGMLLREMTSLPTTYAWDEELDDHYTHGEPFTIEQVIREEH